MKRIVKRGPRRKKRGPQKRGKLDDLFSKLVRERAEWTCERCKIYHPEGMRMKLHCSHFYSRSLMSVRYHPLNAAAHCAKCHMELSKAPLEFGEWIEQHLGKTVSESLRIRANTIIKFTQGDKDDIQKEMEDELDRLRRLRNNGIVGRIEFGLPTLEIRFLGARNEMSNVQQPDN